jgi:hypothetical protein
VTTYVNAINAALLSRLSSLQKPVVFGQNIAAGSRIGGLTAGLDELGEAQVINTPNCENTLTAMTFGVALTGRPACFILKQQDFLMLGVDHLVNTFNALRNRTLEAPCVFLMVVVDSGWEGPQSGMNNISSLSDLTGIPAYFASGLEETPQAFEAAFSGAPAFLCVSQAMFKRELATRDDCELAASGFGFNVYRTKADKSPSGTAVIATGLSGLQLLDKSGKAPPEVGCILNTFRYPLDIQDLMRFVPETITRVTIITDEKRFSHPLTSLAKSAFLVASRSISFVIRKQERAWTIPGAEAEILSILGTRD